MPTSPRLAGWRSTVENSTAFACFAVWKCVNTSIDGRAPGAPRKQPASQQFDAMTPSRKIA